MQYARIMQQPIGSGFTAASTAADVIAGIDLTGKVAIVTGGYSGIGVETTRALRAAGAKVIVPARDLGKARTTLAGIDAEVAAMDLGDPTSVSAFARAFLATGQPLHLLVHSAGIMATPFARDARDFESQFATNHLGHFQLATLLMPALRKANGARVVSVSSWGHRFSNVVFDDLHYQRRDYSPWLGYGQSKTANILFAVALDARGADDGIRAFSLHPGTIVGTDLGRHVSKEFLRKAGVFDDHDHPVIDPSQGLKTIEQGAATSVWCATHPQLASRGGEYCENCDVAPPVGDNPPPRQTDWKPNGVFAYAVDRDAAERLWTVSEQLLRS
jgi:NAD(P)-dependent dehydrogenase (short-subunit alcohol dehydrogenase family)